MGRAMNRAERFKEMERLYLIRSYSDAEMAEQLGVERTTVWKDRTALEGETHFSQPEPGKYRIDRMSYMPAIRLKLLESLALYLAARRASRQTRIALPHVASALEKLAVTLHKPMTERLVRAASVVMAQTRKSEPANILETVTEAWVEGLKVRISYRGLRSNRTVSHVVSPFLIEPSLWSDGAYLVGHSDVAGTIIPFKIERIEMAALTTEHFTIPQDFDEQQLLKFAWGIWYSEGEPVSVKLRFMPGDAARRLQESIWHPTQQIEPSADGGCVWSAQVAEWQEMVPWVRGWGADVEVLEPRELRETLVREAANLALLYGIHANVISEELARVLRCWGKTSSDQREFHPALYHMLDVGNVARVLLSGPASVRWRHMLGEALGANATALSDWLPWLIALHDIGKLSIAFQCLNRAQQTRLIDEGFDFGKRPINLPHAYISQVFCEDELAELPESFKRCIAEAIGGHHGQYSKPDVICDARDRLQQYEPSEWRTLRSCAATFLRTNLLHNMPEMSTEGINISAAAAALTGFMIVCDWIGSDSRYFTPQPTTDPAVYIAHSAAQAVKAVEAFGFMQAVHSDAPVNVAELFKDLIALRPLQQAIDAIPAEVLAYPSLTIIEAPTGEGKTEAALALAHRIGQIRGTDELYYALPTMATSNQMFKRLQLHLRDRLHLSAKAKLVHGQAFLVENDLLIEPLADAGTASQDSTIEWFSSKKRALLAPFGVGTIDQVELAALNVRHTTLRLAALAGKVVIVDEVHAYDTYMTTIVARLLSWLKALGSSVILLSATLPVRRRAELVRAFGVNLTSANGNVDAYPSLITTSSVTDGETHTYAVSPPAWQPQKQLLVSTLHFGDDDADVDAKALWMIEQIQDGGCICWITNTVERAQKLFSSVHRNAPDDVTCSLLHAQFPLDERQIGEDELSQLYGPSGTRPQRGIVIGTQVLEQSLDLDFDVMVSDLAPIDLLLQRAGRMHRHDRPRPSAHSAARLWINTVLGSADDKATLSPDSFIYDEYILRLTWRELAQRSTISLPADYRPLVEAVYGDHEVNKDNPLHDAWDKLQAKQAKAEGEARLRLLPRPDPEELFCIPAATMTFEEDENSATWIVAQTRLGPESLNVIPLEMLDDNTCRGPDDEKLALDRPASRETQMRLLRRSLRISRRGVVQTLKTNTSHLPTLFSSSALLKEYIPLLLKHGRAELQVDKRTLAVILDPRLGLVIDQVRQAAVTNESL